MFSKVELLLVNKIDTMEFFNFNPETLTERVLKLNPNIKIIPVSAKTGEGIAEWADWIRPEVKKWQQA